MASRDYPNDYPSVTTILGVLRKIGLEAWFKYNTPQQIKKESDEGKLIGTQIHEAIHDYIKTVQVKVETIHAQAVMNALKGFIQFTKDHPGYTFKNAEIPLTSETYKFNGTLDCLAEHNGLLIADWKTGKAKDKDKPDIYDEYIFQVAAYVYLYNEVNKTNIDRAFILSLAKDKVAYNFLEVTKEMIDISLSQVFFPALSIYNGQKRIKEILKNKEV